MDELWEHVGFIPVPAGPRGRPASVAGSMSYAIFRQSAQPQLAMRVLESAVAPEALARTRAGDRPRAGATVGRRARGARPTLPLGSRPRSSAARSTRPHIPLYPRVSQAAAVDARGGADRALDPEAAARHGRRPDRGDHRAARRPHARGAGRRLRRRGECRPRGRDYRERRQGSGGCADDAAREEHRRTPTNG